MEFHEEIFSRRSFESFQLYRSEQAFCDVFIKSHDTKFHCHKVVLASQSVFLHNKLATDPTCEEIILPNEFGSHAVECLIDFLYTGIINVDNNNFLEILQLQNLLEISDFSESLYQALRRILIPPNIKVLLKHYPSFKTVEKLKNLFDHMFLYSFSTLKDDLAMLGMELLNVISLLSRAELNIEKEADIHSFLVRWISCNKNKLTADDINHALSLVRWKDLDLPYLSAIYFNECPFEETQKPLALNAIKSITKKKGRSASFVRADQYRRSIFSVASYNGSHVWELLRADTTDEEWYDMGECPVTSSERVRCCFHNGWLYVLGNSGDMVRYSVFIKKWEECSRAPHTFTRRYLLLADKEMFACGGDYATGKQLSRYDDASNQWHVCPPMPHYLERFGGAIVSSSLYIVGQSSMEDILIQYYSLHRNTWAVVAEPGKGPFNVPVYAAADSGMMYILGGSIPNENKPEESSILFRYNPAYENATLLHPVPVPAINGVLVSVERSVYCIGGVSKGEVSDTMQRYCPTTDTWTTLDWRYPFHSKRFSATAFR